MTRVHRENPPVSRHKSHRVLQTIDPRADRTRARLAEAFVSLLSRRAYAGIRVSDIVRKAGIGRATFYVHFESKDALLRSEIERIVLQMLVELRLDPCVFDCTQLFAHVQHAHVIYRSLMAAPARVVTERIIQDALEMHIAKSLATRSSQKAAQQEMPSLLPRFVASTILTLVAWSLEQPDPPSPAQLQLAYRRLVGRALSPSSI